MLKSTSISDRRAFSMVELLIVVAIIALLASIILAVASKVVKVVRSWEGPPPVPAPTTRP